MLALLITIIPFAHSSQCPTCKSRAMANLLGFGDMKGFNPDLHSMDHGVGGIVFTKDAIHHGKGGIMISADAHQDFLKGKPRMENLDDALGNAELAALRAEIKANEDKKRLAQLDLELNEKRSHEAKHRYEKFLAEKIRAENLAKKTPEVFAKENIPVVTFPKDGFPFFHHNQKILMELNKIREEQLALIEAQQKVAKLDDITSEIANMNPGIKDPHHYANILMKAGANNFLYKIPINPDSGKFYISSSGHGNHKCLNHPEHVDAHSNSPEKITVKQKQGKMVAEISTPININTPFVVKSAVVPANVKGVHTVVSSLVPHPVYHAENKSPNLNAIAEHAYTMGMNLHL